MFFLCILQNLTYLRNLTFAESSSSLCRARDPLRLSPSPTIPPTETSGLLAPMEMIQVSFRRFSRISRIMSRAAVIKLVCCIDNDIVIDLTNLSLVSTALPPSVPSQDEVKKINDLEKKIITEAEHSKKVYERKIKIRGLETEMKKKQVEQAG